MTRLRLLVVAVLVLAASSCQFIEQENFISFTLDGVQYIFTVSAVESDHPYAIGYYSVVGEPVREYWISGSATAAGAAEQPPEETLAIRIVKYEGEGWGVYPYFYDTWGQSPPYEDGWIPLGMIDTFIANRDAVGEQFTGSMPGPFSDGQMTSTLENIVFSVERLPDRQLID